MARITIVGSGIVGMACAYMLSRSHEVTIVARNLPGDEPSIEWASPWAGVSFIAGHCASLKEAKMQLDAFAELWRLSAAYPESSLRRITVEDFHDDKTEDQIWWKDYMPEFRLLPSNELPPGVKVGISYKTVVCNPTIFLPWFRQRLEGMGVHFRRMKLTSLSDAQSIDGRCNDVLINATGAGSLALDDVRDHDVEMIRGQTMLVKSNYDKMFMRDTGDTYTYAIPRMDGTVILGGVRQMNTTSPEIDWDICQDIVNRLHANLPRHFSSDLSTYTMVGHNVGLRPGRRSGMRIEKEERNNGQRIVHAYGAAGGGYIFSFGIARAVRDLVEDYLFPHAGPAKL